MTIKLFSKLFGYDYEMVKRQPTASRQKIVTMGSLMLIPVMLWMFSGFYISRELMEKGLMGSILTALVLGFIVFIVDRSFIATPKIKGGSYVLLYRLAFAFITTCLGALAIDLMVFSGDLEEYRAGQQEIQFQQAKEDYLKDQVTSLEPLKTKLHRLEQEKSLHTASFIAEMEGKGGTGTYGRGKVADAKEALARKAATEAQLLAALIREKEETLKSEAESYATQISGKKAAAILSKIEDLHAYLASHPIGELVYWLFFFLIFFLEGAFVLYKFTTSRSLFEELLLAEEAIGMQRLTHLKERRAAILQEDRQLPDSAESIRQLAKGQKLRKIM